MATTLALPYTSILSVPSLRILGNDTGAARSAKALTAAEVRSLLTVPTVAEVAAGYQPLDSDLTSIAALGTTSYGRSLLTLADASAGRSSFDVYSTTQINASLATKADLVGGVIPTSQIPAIAITEYLGTVANQAAMLALNGDRGDWCLRSDLGTTWVLSADDSTLLASWTQLNYPTAPVTSVNGSTGAVVLNAASVGAQASDAELTALAGLTSAADRLPYFTGSGSAALATFTAFGRTLVDDADAATARGTLGLAIGTNVQAFDADLSSLAAASGTNTIYYRSAADTWSPVTIGANLTFTGGTLAATGGGGGSPGGSNTQIQFNDGGAFAGASGFVWDKTNLRLGLSVSAPVAVMHLNKNTTASPNAALYNATTDVFCAFGEDNTATVFNFVHCSSVNVGDRPAVLAKRARGSLASPSAVANGDAIFSFLAGAFDGTIVQNSAMIQFEADATPVANTSAPQRIVFFTGTNFSDRTPRLTVSSSGGIYGGSNRLEIRDGTNSQQLALFATWSSATSFEALDFRYTSGVGRFEFGPTVGSAGGTVRSLAIGMRNSGGTFTRWLQFASGGGITVSGTMTIEDGLNFVLNTTTGTKIATATNQKLGFWNATPVVQPASANQAALSLDVDVTGGDTVDKAAVNANFSALQTLVNQLRSDLVSVGLLKGAA